MTEEMDTAPQEELSKDVRMWAMICHIGGLAGYLIPYVGNIVAPLIIWMIKKEEHPFIDEQGKEALNFQISITIYSLVASLLCIVMIPAVFVVWIVGLVFAIIAAIKANDGISYRYPLTIRLIK